MGRLKKKKSHRKRSLNATAIGLLAGAILGNIAGELLKNAMPTLDHFYTVGFKPSRVDLSIIALTVGCDLKVNILAVVGALAGALIFSRR